MNNKILLVRIISLPKRFFRNLLFSIGLLMCASNSFSAVIIDAQCTSGVTTGSWIGSITGQQTFTPTVNGTLFKVRVHTATYGSSTNITLKVYSGPTPGSGILLATVVYFKPASTNSWDDVILPGPGVVLTNGSPYYIEIVNGSAVDWIRTGGNVYAPGTAYRAGIQSYDYNFECHMAVPACGTVVAGATQSGVIANTPSAPLALNAAGDPGAWTTSGAGSFADTHNPNTTYTPNCNEAGTATTLTWTSSCTMSATTQIINVAAPSFGVTPSASICNGQSANLTAGGASTYAWNPGGMTTASVNVTPGTTTTYTVTGTQSNGCTVVLNSIVTVNPLPTMTSPNSATICSNGPLSIPLTATQVSTFTWIAQSAGFVNGESLTSQTTSTINDALTSTATTPQNVTYSVVPTATTTGCQGPQQIVTVTVNPLANVTSSSSSSVCSGLTIGQNLTSSIAATFNWIGGDNTNTTGESTTSQSGSTLSDIVVNNVFTNQPVTYTIIATASAGGCPGPAQVYTATVKPKPSMTSASSATVCSGLLVSIPLTASVASTFSWIAADNVNTTGESTTSQSTSTLNNTIINNTGSNQPVTYSVTPVSSPGACTGLQQIVTVTVNAAPSPNAGPDAFVCNGSSAVMAGSASGGTGPYAYQWFTAPTGGTSLSALQNYNTGALVSGTYNYYLEVVGSNGCVSSGRDLATATAFPSPTLSLSNTPVTCNGGSNGTINSTPSGGTAPYQFSINGGAYVGGASFTGLAPGNYTVTTRDNNTCVSTGVTTTITQPTAITSSISSSTNVSCNGGSNGSATVFASGGTPGYTYSWAPSGGTTATASGLTTGTYTCTITDANACTKTQTVTITQPTVITSSISSSTNVSCNGGSNGSATVFASGGTPGYTYSWAPSGGTTATASGLTTGTYTCTITDANGCTKTQTVTITQPTAITSSISGSTNASCNGGSNGSATVFASGGTPGYTYSWAPSGGTTTTASGLAAGTYTCTITDANTCVKTQTVTITQPTAITSSISSSTNVSCNGGSNGSATVFASGGTPGYTYSWAPSGGTTPTASGLAAGTYTCTITDANACTKTQTVTITQPTVITSSISSSTNVSCNGGSNGSATVFTSGGTPVYTYSWAPSGGTTATASGLTTGTYTCTITDANSCTKTQTVTISQPTVLTAIVVATTSVTCWGYNDGTMDANQSGGVGPYLYSIDGGAFYNGGTNFNGLPPGTYSLTVKDANNCISAGVPFTITEPTTLNAIFNPTDVTCNGGNDGTVSSSSTFGGTPPYQSSLNGGAFVATSTFTGLFAGSYTIAVRDANACTSGNATLTVAEPTLVVASVGSVVNVDCSGNNNGSATASATGGVGPYQFSLDAGVYGPATSLTGLAVGSHTLIAKDASNCLSSPLVFSITEPSPLTVNGTGTTTICSNDVLSIALSGAGGTVPYSFQWIAGDNANTTGESTGTIAGGTINDVINNPTAVAENLTYTMTVTDNNACVSTQTINVAVNPNPIAIPGNGGDVCFGTPATFNTTPAASYVWNFGDGNTSNIQNPSNNYAVAGTYTTTLVITSPAGCTSTAGSVITTVNPMPLAPSAGSNSPVCEGAVLTLTSGSAGATSFNWTGPGAYSSALQNPVLNPVALTDAGTYTVTATQGPCTSPTTTVLVNVNATPTLPTPTSNSPVCLGSSISLNTPSFAGATNYLWDYGDGSANFSTAANVTATHFYSPIGTYTVTVTVTASGGCSNSGTTVVITDDTPLAPTLGSSSPVCEGDTLGFTAISAGATSYNWSGPNGFTSSLQNPAISPSTIAANGTYTVTATLGVCTSPPSTIIATVNPIPSVSASSNSPVCEGGVLTLLSTPSGGSAPYNFSWSGPAAFTGTLQNPMSSNAALTMSGTYTVSIADANGCVSLPATTAVNINPKPNFNITAPSTICLNYNLNLSPGTITGGSVFNYNWNGPGAFNSPLQNPIRNNVLMGDAGNYILDIINEFGCSATDTFNVSIIPTPIANITGGPNVVCANEYASLSGSTSSGNSGTISSYQWIVGGTPIAGANLVGLSANTPGAYYLEVINTNGCADTSVVFALTNKAIPVPLITGNASYCSGTSSLLDGSTSTAGGGAASISSYQWIHNGTALAGATGANHTATVGGNYELILFNSNGCTDTSTAFFLNEQFPPVAPTITSPGATYCLNDSLLLSIQTPTAGHTYNWSHNPTIVSLNNPSNTTAYIGGQSTGTYTVSVTETDLNGCISAPGSYNVIVSPLPVANAIPPANTTICYNGSVSVSMTTVTGATYNWSSTSGLSSTSQSPTFTNITTTGSVLFFGTVTDAIGCTSLQDTIGISVSAPIPAPTISSGGAICEGQSLNLFASPVVAGATYTWVDPFSASQSAINLTSITIPTATVADAGPYTLTYTDVNGCTSLVSPAFSETINPLPIVSISGTNSFCIGGSTLLSASTAVGSASGYQWLQNGSPIAGANSASYMATTGGNYNVIITLTSGCFDSAPTVTPVTVNPLPNVSINPSSVTICEGTSTGLSVTGANTYVWSTGATSSTLLVSPTTGTTYIVTGTDANGCSKNDTAFVAVNVKPAAPTTSVSSSSACAGTGVTFNSGSSLTNTWFNVANGSTISNLQSFSHTETIPGVYNYGVYVTDANSCNSDTSLTAVTFNSCLTTLNPELDNTMANTPVSNNVLANDGSPSGYTVNTTPVLAPTNGTFTINTSGSYTYVPTMGFSGYDMIVVNVCDASSNCANDTIVIRVSPYAGTDLGTVSGLIPNSVLTGNVTANDAGSGIAGSVVLLSTTSNGVLVISAAGDFTYAPTANYCGKDSFNYQITDANNLTATAYCIIDVSCTVVITTPSGFSPNNDGVNDKWVINGIDISSNKVTIYDRWGNEIWSEQNYNNTTVAWEGKNKNGEELTGGTYFYMIEVDGQTPVRGWVEITK